MISSTSLGAPNILLIFWNRKLLINPLFTTSTERIFLGIVNTFSASSSISSPCSSSPITGKKLRSSLILPFLSSAVPPPCAVFGFKLFANCSYIVSVLAGSKSNTYAFSFLLKYVPSLKRQGFCARKAACI